MTDKLRVMASPKLATVRDLAGARLVVDAHPTTTYLLAAEVQRYFEEREIRTALIDRNAKPAQGYRAIHLELRTPAGMCELQVRTYFQSKWATLYERLGDVLGRGIRYESSLKDYSAETQSLVKEMRELSDVIARLENSEESAADAFVELRDHASTAWNVNEYLAFLTGTGAQMEGLLGLTAKAIATKLECMSVFDALSHRVSQLEGSL